MRPVLLLIAAVGLTACDLTPTGPGPLAVRDLDRLMRNAGGRASPAQAALLRLIEKSNDATSALVLPQLDSLFELAMQSKAGAGGGEAAEDRDAHDRILERAWQAIEADDRSEGDRLLASARRFQAERVVEVFGAPAPMVYQSLLELSISRAFERLGPSAAESVERARLRRMAGTARDLAEDARRAMAEGDAPGALDLASLAAGLANQLQQLLPAR